MCSFAPKIKATILEGNVRTIDICLLFLELAASVQVVAAAGLSAQERVGAGRHLRQGAPLRPQVDQWGFRLLLFVM